MLVVLEEARERLVAASETEDAIVSSLSLPANCRGSHNLTPVCVLGPSLGSRGVGTAAAPHDSHEHGRRRHVRKVWDVRAVVAVVSPLSRPTCRPEVLVCY